MSLLDGLVALNTFLVILLIIGGIVSAVMHNSHNEKVKAMGDKLAGTLKQVNEIRREVYDNARAIPPAITSQPLTARSALDIAEQLSAPLQPGTDVQWQAGQVKLTPSAGFDQVAKSNGDGSNLSQ